MIKIRPTYYGELSLEALNQAATLSPSATRDIIGLGWRHGLHATGRFTEWDSLNLRLVDVVRLRALDSRIPMESFSALVERSRADADESPAVAAAATVTLRDPDAMRWITANPDHVAASPKWHQVVVGLGGLTVSTPLAEEALISLMRAKCKLPRELSTFVQLNPWFPRRFAVRFRRRVGGKRIRIRERDATARAWSHARTLLGTRVPYEWSSLHGRGRGRPLDRWSERLLADYADVFVRVYEQTPIAATAASLYAIAAGAINVRGTGDAIAAGWDALPLEVERRGRAMLGLPGATAERDNADALAHASQTIGSDAVAWREIISRAFLDREGLVTATRHLAQ
ncbi:MAG: hypothetical protein QNJ81_05180 [Acidimicrobiia bacterium]|nr:hypothetical protein [Acidimicrobiia bacterium]